MFGNLFEYLGPMWSAAALLGIVLVLFGVAALQTARLAIGSSHGPGGQVLGLLQLRRGLERAWVAGAAGLAVAVRDCRWR